MAKSRKKKAVKKRAVPYEKCYLPICHCGRCKPGDLD